jgi:5-methyltetrahydrofolate--homocysteine methyltransferase
VDAPLVLDSPNPSALERALKANKNSKPIINSLTGESKRFNEVMPLVAQYKTGIVALCMDDSGMPETAGDRVRIAGSLIKKLTGEGVGLEDIYIDPMVRPISTGSHYGPVVLDTIRRVREEYPGVHLACGLSNISFGLPNRKLINQAFLIAAMAAGLDAAILDPLDKKLMSFLCVAEALLGQDEFCMDYLNRYREGRIEE